MIRHENLGINVIISDSSICIRLCSPPGWSLLAGLSKPVVALVSELEPRCLPGSTPRSLMFVCWNLYEKMGQGAQLRNMSFCVCFILTLLWLETTEYETQIFYLIIFFVAVGRRQCLLIHLLKLGHDSLLEHGLYLGQFLCILCSWRKLQLVITEL